MVPPKRILLRDPRNFEHRAEVYRVIQQYGGVHVTRRTRREIEPIAHRFPKMTVSDDMTHAVGVAHFFFPDEGLMFPDNRISKCADCRIALQCRPHFVVPVILCCFCAGDRLLQEYWNSKQE